MNEKEIRDALDKVRIEQQAIDRQVELAYEKRRDLWKEETKLLSALDDLHCQEYNIKEDSWYISVNEVEDWHRDIVKIIHITKADKNEIDYDLFRYREDDGDFSFRVEFGRGESRRSFIKTIREYKYQEIDSQTATTKIMEIMNLKGSE